MRMKLQFGLKWFLLATTLIAVLVGTVGKRLYDRWQNNVVLERRARAIRELEEFGVGVDRAYHRDGNRDGPIVRLQFPQQVCKPRHFRLAADIGGLESLELWYTGFSDSDVPTLAAHPNLKRLSLSFNPAFTDQGLKSVAELKALEQLELAATGVTNEGLREIARLPKLQSLRLERSAVTSPGLVHLRPLQSLVFLGLTFTEVDDSGLAAIGELRALEGIGLNNTRVRGPGLAALAKLPKLESLQLRGCPLQDGSGLAKLKQVTHLSIDDTRISPGILSHIHEMDSLRHLNLKGSAINDEHLLELASAKQLTSLILGKTVNPRGPIYPQDISDGAIRELKAALPNTRIVGIPGDP